MMGGGGGEPSPPPRGIEVRSDDPEGELAGFYLDIVLLAGGEAGSFEPPARHPEVGDSAGLLRTAAHGQEAAASGLGLSASPAGSLSRASESRASGEGHLSENPFGVGVLDASVRGGLGNEVRFPFGSPLREWLLALAG